MAKEKSIWDEEVFDDGEDHTFPVADPGTYSFEVVDLKASEYIPGPNSKIGRCASFNLRLRVEAKVDGKDKEVNVFDRLYSDHSTSWKIKQFAKCVGIWHDKMTLREFLKKAPGTTGTAEIGQRTYNGKLQNQVNNYIDPDEAEEKKERAEIAAASKKRKAEKEAEKKSDISASIDISDDDLPF